MTSQEIYELEREQIFDKCWLYVGHESEIAKPGDFKRRNVGGRPIIFIPGRTARSARSSTPARTAARRSAVRTPATPGSSSASTTRGPSTRRATWSRCPTRPAIPSASTERNTRLRPARFDNYRGFYFLNYNPDAEELPTTSPTRRTTSTSSCWTRRPNGVHVIEGTNLYGIKANWKLLCENASTATTASPLHSTYFDYIASYGRGRRCCPEPGEEWQTVRDLGNGHATLDYPNRESTTCRRTGTRCSARTRRRRSRRSSER